MMLMSPVEPGTGVAVGGAVVGVDVSGALELQEKTGLRVVASGGVSTLKDVQQVKEAGLAGVIIGRALYESRLSLRAVLSASQRKRIHDHHR